MSEPSGHQPDDRVGELAAQVVSYVERSLGIALEYDSDTLPLLDHYLREVPTDNPSTARLVLSTAGPYFGEVVRRHLGGRWELGDDPLAWRLVLPIGLSFAPAGMVAAAILRTDDIDEPDTGLEVPAGIRPHLEDALERMADVPEDEYYSLCGRLDTFEHIQAVLVAVADRLRAEPAS